MPLPFIIGAAVLAAAGVGVAAGLSAKERWEKAESIAKRATRRYDKSKDEFTALAEAVQLEFEKLGQTKIDIFHNQITHIVEILSKVSNKSVSSQVQGFENTLTADDLKQLQHDLKELDALEVTGEAGTGLMAGALAGFGAYGTVGALAAASTGTAISSLAGAAATNATLAWLGGGSLAAGGLGIAGGAAVLGGIIAAPAILVAGVFMESKASEALTEAEEYAATVDIEIGKIKQAMAVLEAIQLNAQEMQNTLDELILRFEKVKVYDSTNEVKFQQMLMIGKALKEALHTPLVTNEGEAELGISVKCSGLLEATRNI